MKHRMNTGRTGLNPGVLDVSIIELGLCFYVR